MNREILRLAIPNILSNLTVPMLSVVDVALMGHLSSEVYLGAIALSGIVFSYIYWALGFLRMGTTGMTAQAHGAENFKECTNLLYKGLLIAFAFAMLILALQAPLKFVFFYFFNASESTLFYAYEYFDVRIWAAPATLSLLVLNGWFLGRQNAWIPLLIALVANLSNAALNYVFVYEYGMLSTGVALGTVCAQYLALLVAIGALFWKYRPQLKLEAQLNFWKKDAWTRFFSINSDIFLRTIFLCTAFYALTKFSADFGPVLLAATNVLMQLVLVTSYGVDGFAYAAESLVGKYHGSRNQMLMNRSIQYAFYWGGAFALIFVLFFLVAGEQSIRLMTSQPETILVAKKYIGWVIFLPILSAAAYIWDGVYIGATAVKAMRNSMFIATFIFFIPIYYLAKGSFGAHAIWIAFYCYMITRTLLLSLWAKKSLKIKAT